MTDASGLKLRRASAEDEDLLLDWRNDPEARAEFRTTHEVGPDEHRRWLRQTLADPECDLLIAELDATPVGQVRFDRRAAGEREISVSLAARFRGRGHGAQLIRSGVDWLRRERGVALVVAEVRLGNDASLRAFRAAGFRETPGRASEGFARLELSVR